MGVEIMATVENLIPTNKRSKEEARELGRIGGQKSGQVRREKKMLKQLCEERLLKKMANGETLQDNLITKAESLVFSNKAKLSEILKFFELLRDTSGQKPVDKVAQTNSEGKDIPLNDLSKIPTETLLQMAEKAGVNVDINK